MSNHNQVQKARGGAVVQVVLWLALAVSGAVNSIGYFVGLGNVPRMAAGAVAVLCIVLLIVFYVTRRSR